MNNFSNHLKKFLSVLCIFSLSSISITNSKCFGAVTQPNFVTPTPTVTPNIPIGGEPSNYTILLDTFRQLFPDQEPTQEQQTAMEETVTPNCRMKCSGCGVAKWKGGVCVENKN